MIAPGSHFENREPDAMMALLYQDHLGPGCRCTCLAQYVASTSHLAVRRQSGFHIISSRQHLEDQTFCDPLNILSLSSVSTSGFREPYLAWGSLPFRCRLRELACARPGSSFNPKSESRVPVSCNGTGGPCSHLAVLLTP